MSVSSISRRQFLKTSALVVAGGALAACVAPSAAPAQPAASDAAAPAGELVELSYLTPDRELENRTKEVLVKGFNTRMEETGKPWRVVGVVGPATDNDIKTKLTLDKDAPNCWQTLLPQAIWQTCAPIWNPGQIGHSSRMC